MDLQSNSQNIAAILDIHAETRNHPAILSEDTVWSYTDLANRVKAKLQLLIRMELAAVTLWVCV